MEIRPVQNFQAMSTPKKVATVVGTVAATAAVASVPVAMVKGKKAGAEGIIAKLKEGYSQIGASIAKIFHKTQDATENAGDKATSGVENGASVEK